MPSYLSPGVYVEEVASGSAPIAGVGTSTAGFIGILEMTPTSSDKSSSREGSNSSDESPSTSASSASSGTATTAQTAVQYSLPPVTVEGEVVSAVAGQTVYTLAAPAAIGDGTGVKVTVDGAAMTGTAPIKNASGKLKLTLPAGSTATDKIIKVDYTYTPSSVPNLRATLCTNFAEFKKSFGDFPSDTEETSSLGRRTLTHAVYGFFNNGGTRCYVVWVKGTEDIDKALDQFEAIDEIAIVAVPGATDAATLGKVDAHCRQATQDRVAIFDAPMKADNLEDLKPGGALPGKSDYAALYYPWIEVYDPAVNKRVPVPPSGHIAGIYARVDSQRGVYKAPANEPLLGALGVTDPISKRKQDGLNPQGVNCIRALNGSILVWGARTWGGDANGEFKYISTRRLFNYLRESIDEGTQWIVFEPNSPELWAKIRRSLTAFLTTVWRTGALFGATPEQAFFIKCDEETNPIEVREQGQVVTIIGVAVVKPAEFVIFRISQWAGPGGS